jgi:hypothetical protein
MPRGGPRPNSARNKRSIGIAERMVEAGGDSRSAAPQLTAKKLARDVLESFMLKFTDLAKKETNPVKFERYARFAVYCAQSLAPYQSPTLRAVMVAPQPENNDTTITLKIFDHDGNEVKNRSSDLDDPIEACKVYRRIVGGIT